jgi:hypothetical protein
MPARCIERGEGTYYQDRKGMKGYKIKSKKYKINFRSQKLLYFYLRVLCVLSAFVVNDYE